MGNVDHINRTISANIRSKINLVCCKVIDRVRMAVLRLPTRAVLRQRQPCDAMGCPVHLEFADPVTAPFLIRRELIAAVRDQFSGMPHGKVTISFPIWGQGNLHVACAIRQYPPHIAHAIGIVAVVNNGRAITLPHFMAGPVIALPAFAFRSQTNVPLAIPKPHPADARLGTPLVVIENQMRVTR